MARSERLRDLLYRKATGLERLLWRAAPKWSQVRVHHRLMAGDTDYREAFDFYAQLRGYKAAAPGKSKSPWIHASDRDADGELVGDLPTLRNRSRATTRDDPIGSGVVGTLVRKVVGTGVRSQVRIKGQTEKSEVIEAVADELLAKIDRANVLDYPAHQRLVYQRTLEDGDVLLRAVVRTPGEPVWVEVVEGERLATPMDAAPQTPRGRIVAGVEKDEFGIPVAYWVMRRHPNEHQGHQVVTGALRPLGTVPVSKSEFDRVPAEQCVLVRARVTRSGQTRGVPIFHSCVQDLHDLDLLILASLKRTQVAACLSMFISSAGDTVDLLELTAEDYGYRLEQTIEPGMIFRLFPGEKAEFLNPTAGVPDLDRFVMLLAKRVGASVGLSPQTVLQAWEGLSYSTARTIKTGEQQTIRLERSSFVSQACAWERRIVLEDALLRGEPRLMAMGVTRLDLAAQHASWIGDEEQWVDPATESAATKDMLEMGLTSLQIECARLGRDWEDVLRQRLEAELREREMRAELGLPERVEKPTIRLPEVEQEGPEEPEDVDQDEQPTKEAA